MSDEAIAYLDEQVSSGQYKSIGDFLEELVSWHRGKAWTKEELEAELVRRLDDPLIEMNDEFWDDVEREGTRLIEERRAKRNK